MTDKLMPNKVCVWSGKIQYTSVPAARKAMRNLSHRRKSWGGRLQPYRCPSCAQVHLGHWS